MCFLPSRLSDGGPVTYNHETFRCENCQTEFDYVFPADPCQGDLGCQVRMCPQCVVKCESCGDRPICEAHRRTAPGFSKPVCPHCEAEVKEDICA